MLGYHINTPGWTASTVSATLWSLSTSGPSSCQMIQQFLRELLTKSWWEMKMVVHETISIFAGMLDNVHTAHPADCWHGNTYRQHCEQKNTYFYFQKNIFTSLKISMKALEMFPMRPSRHDPGAVLVCQLQFQRHRPEQPQAGQVHCDCAPHSSGKC